MRVREFTEIQPRSHRAERWKRHVKSVPWNLLKSRSYTRWRDLVGALPVPGGSQCRQNAAAAASSAASLQPPQPRAGIPQAYWGNRARHRAVAPRGSVAQAALAASMTPAENAKRRRLKAQREEAQRTAAQAPSLDPIEAPEMEPGALITQWCL